MAVIFIINYHIGNLWLLQNDQFVQLMQKLSRKCFTSLTSSADSGETLSMTFSHYFYLQTRPPLHGCVTVNRLNAQQEVVSITHVELSFIDSLFMQITHIVFITITLFKTKRSRWRKEMHMEKDNSFVMHEYGTTLDWVHVLLVGFLKFPPAEHSSKDYFSKW
jgi:hypothetical protein